jgi:hypothetical protein
LVDRLLGHDGSPLPDRLQHPVMRYHTCPLIVTLRIAPGARSEPPVPSGEHRGEGTIRGEESFMIWGGPPRPMILSSAQRRRIGHHS